MKMSAARIRSVFRRHNSVEEQVFRFSRNIRRVTRDAPVPACAIAPQPDSVRLDALNQHYQAAIKHELAKIGL